jgi:hypothetical protein
LVDFVEILRAADTLRGELARANFDGFADLDGIDRGKDSGIRGRICIDGSPKQNPRSGDRASADHGP